MRLNKLFDKPKLIGLVADTNQGKSNMIYAVLEDLKKEKKFSLYTYGLRKEVKGSTKVHSVAELEKIRNSLIVVDEFFGLFDLDNRKAKRQIENTIRLIFHNNNILWLIGLGENFKKFISGKLHVIMYKSVSLADLINGSRVKNVLMEYKGEELGTAILNVGVGEALIYDGIHYYIEKIPYMKEYDTKASNEEIFKTCAKTVRKNVQKGGK